MRFNFNVPQPIDLKEHLTSSIRMLGGLAIFAFLSFAAIDPMVTPVYHTGFLWVRGVSIAILAGLMSLSWKALSDRQLLWVGAIICTLTGVVVTILSQMAGGPESHYWTMLMLLFFGTVTLLPAPTKWSVVIMSFNIAFYILWMTVWDSWEVKPMPQSAVQACFCLWWCAFGPAYFSTRFALGLLPIKITDGQQSASS